jgi:hypothetical protein
VRPGSGGADGTAHKRQSGRVPPLAAPCGP